MGTRGAAALALGALALSLSCGGAARPPAAAPSATATPRPSASASANPTPTPTAVPSAAPTPTPAPVLAAGSPAWVAVSVATVWRSPGVVRAVDAPALANPVRLGAWLAALGDEGREGLIDRADTQVLLGDRVGVLALDGEWALVTVPDQATPLDARGYPGWMPRRQLTAWAPPAAATTATVIVPTASMAGGSAGGSLQVGFGTRLPVLGRQGDTVIVGLPAGGRGSVAASSVSPAATGAPALPATAAAVLSSARRFLGLPYLWAGTSGFGFDCSGLVYLVYRTHGVLLPRDAAPQSEMGRRVAAGELQPGDLVFYADGEVHHVAIYAGGGSILESPHTGAPVRIAPLGDYASARRVLP